MPAPTSTSDADNSLQTVNVSGTIDATGPTAKNSVERPLDLAVTIPGSHSQGEWEVFTHTLGTDPQSLHPVKVYDESYSQLFGVGKYATNFGQGTDSADMFGDGSDGDLTVAAGQTVYADNVRSAIAATANAGLYLGLKPVFADIEEDTGNINPALIENEITPRTKFIVPVHYSGHPADLGILSAIAKKHDLKIIEDASHAVGAKYRESTIGDCTYSEMVTFSFHPVKHITTGEGGAVLTNNEKYYTRLKMFRSHGITKSNMFNTEEGDWYYEMHHLGHNYRMTDFQAALGISQLSRLEANIRRRRDISSAYGNVFHNHPFFHIPPERDYAFSSYHLYPVRLKDKSKRRSFFEKLHESNIRVQVHYIPVYLHPYYKKLGYREGLCPVSEDFYEREISLPIYPGLKPNDQASVIHLINTLVDEC